MKEINQRKKELRESFLKIRMNYDKASLKVLSDEISIKVRMDPIYKRSNNIMFYAPFKNEVMIDPIIDDALMSKKNVIIPKTIKETKEIIPYMIRGWDELELGNYDILEPKTINQTPFDIEKIELVIVPGLAFDKYGYRLGYGGGYYDRFFDKFSKLPVRIALAYDFQIVDYLPRETHDYPMDIVITDKQRMLLLENKSK